MSLFTRLRRKPAAPRPYMSGTLNQMVHDLRQRRAEIAAAEPESLVLFWRPGQELANMRTEGEAIRRLALAECDDLIREATAPFPSRLAAP
jgi:hypothetical protein